MLGPMLDSMNENNSKNDKNDLPANSISFHDFCDILELVSKTNKLEIKIKRIFSKWLRSKISNTSIYPFLRLLLPHLDRERNTYDLKEKKLAKIYMNVLGMNEKSKDSQQLLNYTNPTIVESSIAVGDFGQVVADILKFRINIHSSKDKIITIGDINSLLDDLVTANTTEMKRSIFRRLFFQNHSLNKKNNKSIILTPNEHKWLIRIILKDLKIGIREERILASIHPDAMELYNHTNDLNKVCHQLNDSSVRYIPKIIPFQIFTPMLAKRCELGEAIHALNGHDFIMEPKLDGERLLCHKSNDDFKTYSRNGTDYSNLYGICIKEYMDKAILVGIDYILDGEMMVWDNNENRFRDFGELKSAASNQLHHIKNKEEGMKDNMSDDNTPRISRWLCYIIWDIIYIGNSSKVDGSKEILDKILSETIENTNVINISGVVGLPLIKRKEILERIVTPLKKRIELNPYKIILNTLKNDEKHKIVMEEVDKSILAGNEGLLLKELNTHYMFGETSRKTKKWIKLKPDYSGMTTDLDVIIIGGYYGEGKRRRGDVSHFLVGVLHSRLGEEEVHNLKEAPSIYTFGKVGTGYSLQELGDLRTKLEPYWRKWDENNIPSFFMGWKPLKSDLRPDFWIDPRDSQVLEIYGFELNYTSLFLSGLTLRFPRCRKIRNDKNWYECLSLHELNILKANSSNNNKRASDILLAESKKTKKKTISSTKKVQTPYIINCYSENDFDSIEKRSNLFENQEFCVLPGKINKELNAIILHIYSTFLPKSDANIKFIDKPLIEKLIFIHGGTCVQNPIEGSTDYIFSLNNNGIKFNNLCKQGKYDILNITYLFKCLKINKKCRPTYKDYFYRKLSTVEEMDKEFDRYGDSFIEKITDDELREMFKDMEEDLVDRSLTWQEEIENHLLLEEQEIILNDYYIFCHCVIHLYIKPLNKRIENLKRMCEEMEFARQQIIYYGGRISSFITRKTTHIIIDPSIFEIKDEEYKNTKESLNKIICEIRNNYGMEPIIIKKEWIFDSIYQKEQINVLYNSSYCINL